MSHLARLQTDFQTFLLSNTQKSSFHRRIVDDPKVGAARRLGIYYDAYRLRLIEALSNAYPKLHVLLGDDLFDSTARSYIDAYPSTNRNMRWFGGDMRKHLANRLPQHPIAAEMAAFEWTLSLAFDATDSPVLQIQDLAVIPPESWGALSFEFQPSLYLLPMCWNTAAVWKALDIEEAPPAVEEKSSPETWLIWRRELNPRFRSLDVMEESALGLAVSGASFGAVCEYLHDQSEEDSMVKAAEYLAGWLEEGMISRFQV